MYPNCCILETSWDGLKIRYIHSENSTSDALIMYVADMENFAVDWFGINPNPQRDYLEISLSPSLFKQIFSQSISICCHKFIQVEITEPSMLHLAHLLQLEMKAPKILSQKYVLAIVTAMIAAHIKFGVENSN